MSSGQYVTETTLHVECTGTVTHTFPLFSSGLKFDQSWPCTFEGEVDVFVDPEAHAAIWTCERCNTEHDAWKQLVEVDA